MKSKHSSGVLGYCPKCREKSVKRKSYMDGKAGISVMVKRVEYCLNKGCGYKQDLNPSEVPYSSNI